jgi:quercetin dioxygenase-like cupin family protein
VSALRERPGIFVTTTDKDNDMAESTFEQIFPLGAPNDAFAQYFTGRSFLAPLTGGAVQVSNVSFEPGCRNHWHIHHGTGGAGDQVLLCTAGSGWFQAEGQDPISLEPGSVVAIPAGTKHWHGAKADSWFSHLAFITPGEDVRNEWLEPVDDEAYSRLAGRGA